MELKQIKELMASMGKAGVKKLRIKEKDKYEVELEMQEECSPAASQPHPQYVYPHPDFSHKFAPSHPVQHHSHAPKEEITPSKEEGKFITAPMVGTLYVAPSPEDSPFVKVGDKVDEQTIVCVVEAMKVMNEVRAGVNGTIAEICVKNGHPVEFGTKLFRVV